MARIDPIPAFRFHVEIEGIIEGAFLECKGLGLKWKVFKYKEGGVNNYVHQLPERVDYSKVTLKRGVDFSHALWDWCQQGIRNGRVERKNVSIVQFNTAGEEVKRWNLTDAYPINWKGPQLKSQSKKVAIETLQLVYNGLTLDDQV
ncbi:MAG: phage tail protein [Chloroflexi bacterium]|nr:MAG: hypothetical protein B6I34_03855 [Anaerolineaceae bacterium 4572_32.1]RLC74399.1 MAG: phage tail protein [Chloroflexota bacterium]RLC95645.1 MAG: phage tail protein [Chloroflexota bacterium]